MKVACSGADSKHYSCWVCWSISVQDTLKCYLCQFQVQNSIFCLQFGYSFFFDLQPRIQTENPSTQRLLGHTEILRMHREHKKEREQSQERTAGKVGHQIAQLLHMPPRQDKPTSGRPGQLSHPHPMVLGSPYQGQS